MSDRNDRPPSTRPTTTLSPPPIEQLHTQSQSQEQEQERHRHHHHHAHHGLHLADSHDGGAPLTSAASHSHSPGLQVQADATNPSQTQAAAAAAPHADHPPFNPLFTLVSNTSSRTTHHPRVHYIFSDDDPDVLDQAIAQQHQHAHARARDPADDSSAVFPPTDRAVVLDLVPSPDGSSWEVAWASSLSPAWAVLGSRLSRMEEGHQPYGHGRHGRTRSGQQPHNDDRHDDDDEDAERPLMLEIEGVERERPSTSMTNAAAAAPPRPPTAAAAGDDKAGGGSSLMRSSGSTKSVSREDPSALVEEFKSKMGLLHKVIRAGQHRPARADQIGQEDQPPTTLHADGEVGQQHQGQL